jgi:hypothetical protein
MQIWNYDSTTGELLGPGAADPDPMTPGGWLIPAHATAIAPPRPLDKFASVFDGTSWSTVEDRRGETRWPTTQAYNDVPGVVVNFLGDPTARGLTSIEPPAPPVVVQPVVATALQLFTALAADLGKTPAEIEALVEIAKTL